MKKPENVSSCLPFKQKVGGSAHGLSYILFRAFRISSKTVLGDKKNAA